MWRVVDSYMIACFAGVAVGSGWQSFVAYINLGTYYLVGIPAGVVMGWIFNLGVLVCIFFHMHHPFELVCALQSLNLHT